MSLTVGMIVSTSYRTGPYIIKKVSGPCTCARYLDQISGSTRESETHFHLTCGLRNAEREGDFYLNGYRPDGSNVWSCDRLTFHGRTGVAATRKPAAATIGQCTDQMAKSTRRIFTKRRQTLWLKH